MAIPSTILEAGLPVEQDLQLVRGDSPRIRFVVRNKSTGAVIPLTAGPACQLVITDATGDSTLLTVAGTIDDQANGTGYVDLSTAQTTALPYPTQADDSQQQAIVGKWYLALTDTGARKTIGRGNLVILSPTDP